MEHIKHVMHGESKTRLYRIWSNLKNRVLPNSVKAKYYFDRGIGLCDEWKNSFISFRDWSINNGYDDKLTLNRIDNDGSYTPENCRWVDMKVQSNNRSNNISVRIEEGCIPFSEICRVLCIDYMYAYNKVVKHLSQEIDVQRIGKNWKEEPVIETNRVVQVRRCLEEVATTINPFIDEVIEQFNLKDKSIVAKEIQYRGVGLKGDFGENIHRSDDEVIYILKEDKTVGLVVIRRTEFNNAEITMVKTEERFKEKKQ